MCRVIRWTMTKGPIVPISYDSPDKNTVARAISILMAGGLVVAPSETRYGLFARADSTAALSTLYRAKGRSREVPTAIFVPSVEHMAHYGEISSSASALAAAFLPGPVTIVVQATCGWGPPVVVGGKIGLRVSAAPVVHALLQGTGVPLSATSANRSGQKDVATIADVADSLTPDVDLYLDCGRLDFAPSTVVDCSGSTVVVLREGAVNRARVLAALTGLET